MCKNPQSEHKTAYWVNITYQTIRDWNALSLSYLFEDKVAKFTSLVRAGD